MVELELFQVDRPVPGQEPSDVVRSFVFLANLAAQEASGETGSSVSVTRAVQRLTGSTESDSLMLVLAEDLSPTSGPPRTTAARSGLGHPLLPATVAGADAEPELEIHGFVHLSIPLHEDLDAVELELVLDAAHQPLPGAQPDEPARAVYRRLLEEAGLVTAQLNRRVLQLWETHPVSAESPFAGELHRAGYRAGLTETQGVIELSALPDSPPDLPAGVRTEVLSHRCPDPALVPGLLQLLHRAATDAPHGALRTEPQQWTAARLAEAEARRAETGLEVLLALLVDAAGPVALCEIHRHPASEPGSAEQGITVVAPRRRGEGLGHAVKYHALRAVSARWPGVERVYTSNARDNAGMLAVNRGLGVREISRATAWQLVLPA